MRRRIDDDLKGMTNERCFQEPFSIKPSSRRQSYLCRFQRSLISGARIYSNLIQKGLAALFRLWRHPRVNIYLRSRGSQNGSKTKMAEPFRCRCGKQFQGVITAITTNPPISEEIWGMLFELTHLRLIGTIGVGGGLYCVSLNQLKATSQLNPK